jgi:transposase InsO family protein
VDLFRCESIVLRTYWVLVVMDQFTRRIVGVGVHQGAVTVADVCRMFNAAIHRRCRRGGGFDWNFRSEPGR